MSPWNKLAITYKLKSYSNTILYKDVSQNWLLRSGKDDFIKKFLKILQILQVLQPIFNETNHFGNRNQLRRYRRGDRRRKWENFRRIFKIPTIFIHKVGIFNLKSGIFLSRWCFCWRFGGVVPLVAAKLHEVNIEPTFSEALASSQLSIEVNQI